MKQSHITIIALLLLVGAFVIAAVFHDSQQAAQQSARSVEHSDALIQTYSPRKGNPRAKVTIVEFMDPACGTCAQFHPFVEDMMAHYGEQVNLVIRYAPFHPRSDEMVMILEAARKQDKFWPVLDLMFETQSSWTINHRADPAIFWRQLGSSGLGVDMMRLQEDMQSPAIAKVIQQDLADGQLLGADKTPTFFVNGKPLPSFGYDQLKDLVSAEVKANY